MAVSALMRRQVGLELLDNITTLKTAVDAVHAVVDAWTLDGADNVLPNDAAVKAQLAAYDAIAKPASSIADALAAVRASGA